MERVIHLYTLAGQLHHVERVIHLYTLAGQLHHVERVILITLAIHIPAED